MSPKACIHARGHMSTLRKAHASLAQSLAQAWGSLRPKLFHGAFDEAEARRFGFMAGGHGSQPCVGASAEGEHVG